MAMGPEDMAAMQEQAGAKEAAGGGITKIAQDVGAGLSKLSEALNGSQGATDADRAQMAQILDLYVDLIEKKLGGQAPGEDAEPEEMPADQGAAPAMGGMKGVPMGPNTRQ